MSSATGTTRTVYDFKAGRKARALAAWRIVRGRAREGHHGVARQAAEMVALWAANGLRPPFYLMAGLYRRELTWAQKRAFVSGRTYYSSLRRINPPAYRIVTNNKVLTHGLLSTFGIPTPTLYGVVHPAHGLCHNGAPLRSASDLAALLDRIPARRVVFKPVEGRRGEGFLKVAIAPGVHPPALSIEPQMRRVDPATLWQERFAAAHGYGYLCQEFVEQHPEAARFHPASLNTVRAWLWHTPGGTWEVYAAVLRMGVGQHPTDNLCTGGIGPRIDVATGRLKPAIERHPDRTIHHRHPTTGVPLEGAVVPMWDEAVALCRRTCAVFPFLRLMAVDIAFGLEGPLVTEVESTPDEHQIGFDRGHGPLLEQILRQEQRS